MFSSELYFKSVNSIYLFNQKTGHKSLSVLVIMTELPILYMSVLLFAMVILTCASWNSKLFILILDNSLYLKNPENPNKNKTQILNLLTSLRSPKTAIIRCKISGVMGSFLQTGLLNSLLLPSRIRDKVYLNKDYFQNKNHDTTLLHTTGIQNCDTDSLLNKSTNVYINSCRSGRQVLKRTRFKPPLKCL